MARSIADGHVGELKRSRSAAHDQVTAPGDATEPVEPAELDPEQVAVGCRTPEDEAGSCGPDGRGVRPESPNVVGGRGGDDVHEWVAAAAQCLDARGQVVGQPIGVVDQHDRFRVGGREAIDGRRGLDAPTGHLRAGGAAGAPRRHPHQIDVSGATGDLLRNRRQTDRSTASVWGANSTCAGANSHRT